MRWTKTLIATLKEDPKDAEAASHKLMIRAGLVRKLASGVYSYLPLGFRVLQKIIGIVREEMNRAGAAEVLLPALQPADLWKLSGRYEVLGADMIHFIDQHGKEMVLGPTHEEVVTDLVAGDVHSYRQLPLILYQIQTKFRDEIRPRFGVVRTREFIMKDAYSFDLDMEGLRASYQKMYDAYGRIFERCGVPYEAVEADPGFMGGETSHEFMVFTEAGEDVVVHCDSCGLSSSRDKTECLEAAAGGAGSDEKLVSMEQVHTPGVKTVEKVSELLKVKPSQLVKTLLYEVDGKPTAVLIRGDHEANETKLKRALGAKVLKLASEEAIQKMTGGPLGFSGPLGLADRGVQLAADHAVRGLRNFVTGANKRDFHLAGVNWGRDVGLPNFMDLRFITEEDPCPKCQKKLTFRHSLEVGHVFQLGTRYSAVHGAKVLDPEGKERTMLMGCYGIGVNRILAAVIETSHDKNGIMWPRSIAPYPAVAFATQPGNPEAQGLLEKIEADCEAAGIDLLVDDRDERAGVKFKDADLIGFPYQIVLGERSLKEGKVELKERRTGGTQLIEPLELVQMLRKLVSDTGA